MKKVLSLAALTAVLASCSATVSVQTDPPTVYSLNNQTTYCTNKTTLLDLGFDFSGDLKSFDIYAVKQDANGNYPQPTSSSQKVSSGQVNTFSFGASHISGTIEFDASSTTSTGNGKVSAQGIVVNPVEQAKYKLYVRGYNSQNAPSTFVGSPDIIIPSNEASCDPDLHNSY